MIIPFYPRDHRLAAIEGWVIKLREKEDEKIVS